MDAVKHLLRGREAARGLEHEDTVGGGSQHRVQLAVRADVVDPGVGAGVGEERETLGDAGTACSAPLSSSSTATIP